MTEPTQQEQVSTSKFNWRWFLLTLVMFVVFLGTQILALATDDWVPFWIQISVSLLFLVFALCNCVFFTYEVSTNIETHKLAWRTARLAFKPYILWTSIAMMTLSWVIALVSYNSQWFFIAFGTTLLVFVIGFYSLRTLVQQIESTETDIK